MALINTGTVANDGTGDTLRDACTSISEVTNTRGWDRMRNPDSLGDISYDHTAKTFSITPKAGETDFHFWADGTKFTKTATESIALSVVTTGTYYILYNLSGALEIVPYKLMTLHHFLMAITGLYYINVEEDALWTGVDEQHGKEMEGLTHANLHMTRKFKWAFGGDFIGFTDGSDVFTQIDSSFHFDEDIPIVTPDITTMPFMYRSGANGGFVITPADNKIGYIVPGDTYVSYNKETLGVWGLEESTGTTDYIIYFVIKSNLEQVPLVQMIGTETYASRGNARDALLEDITAIKLNGLPSTEFEFQGAYICRRNGTLEDSGSPTYSTYINLRGIAVN